MERNEFFPKSSPLASAGGRDLPPREACPLPVEPYAGNPPEPRMERPAEQGSGCGCGCGQGSAGGCGQAPTDDICVGFEGCGADSWGLDGHPLAMVFAPCQGYHALYDPATALCRGTLFTELDLPLGQAECGFSTNGCACRAERRGV